MALRVAAVRIAALLSCVAIAFAAIAFATPLPLPNPAFLPLPKLTIEPCGLKNLGPFFDLAVITRTKLVLGGPLLATLAEKTKDAILGAAIKADVPEHAMEVQKNLLLQRIKQAWRKVIKDAELALGLEAFIKLFGFAHDAEEALLLKAACTIYPWTAGIPDAAKIFKDSYCAKALPEFFIKSVLP